MPGVCDSPRMSATNGFFGKFQGSFGNSLGKPSIQENSLFQSSSPKPETKLSKLSKAHCCRLKNLILTLPVCDLWIDLCGPAKLLRDDQGSMMVLGVPVYSGSINFSKVVKYFTSVRSRHETRPSAMLLSKSLAKVELIAALNEMSRSVVCQLVRVRVVVLLYVPWIPSRSIVFGFVECFGDGNFDLLPSPERIENLGKAASIGHRTSQGRSKWLKNFLEVSEISDASTGSDTHFCSQKEKWATSNLLLVNSNERIPSSSWKHRSSSQPKCRLSVLRSYLPRKNGSLKSLPRHLGRQTFLAGYLLWICGRGLLPFDRMSTTVLLVTDLMWFLLPSFHNSQEYSSAIQL